MPAGVGRKEAVTGAEGTLTAVRPARAIPACLLAALLPGAGHLYLKRTAKGLTLLGCIGAMFGLGLLWDARLQMQVALEDPLAVLRSIAQMGVGVPYLLIRGLGGGAGEVTSPMFEYGNTFTEVAGLLNVLIVIDAFDTAVGRKR